LLKIESPLQISTLTPFTQQAYIKGDSAKVAMVYIVEDCNLMGPPWGIRAICEITVASCL